MIKFPNALAETAPAAQPSSAVLHGSAINLTDAINLKNTLLVAMPNVEDPNFSHSVTYVCEHSDEGAMGITITHPCLR